ncbi:MAG: diguanylate cyclase response regulator [Acidobacteria bacterium]|nr:MAG: diguanylate cyclase response regulator [Acidobacteriota bacterium]
MSVAEQLKQKTDKPQSVPLPLPSVLVAEDDPIFRRVLESWLHNWGYQITALEDGLKAWEAVSKEDAPKLLILDWMMPGMDGPELCLKIRSRKQVPYSYILLLTSKDEKKDLIDGLNAGADDYLTKPFDVNELKARLNVGIRILALQDELIRAKEAVEFQATHDPLTGLWNRGAILDFLRRELDRAQRSSKPFGLLMIDLDHFKRINDTYGHLVGDTVLKEVAQRLAGSVRSYDWVGRYGGEEFLVIVSDCPREAVAKYAERLRAAVGATPVSTEIGEIQIATTIGATSAQPPGYPDQDSLLRFADAALYRAKEQGRNRVELA